MIRIACIVAISCTTALNASKSYGTLLSCEGRCLWTDRNGNPVESSRLIDQMAHDEGLLPEEVGLRRNLKMHIKYMEDLYVFASSQDHTLSYSIGVTPRHLYDDQIPNDRFESVVASDKTSNSRSVRNTSRKLQIAESLNWCDDSDGANPLNRNICTSVKSQQQCGSCWAFAAADSIEAAVALSSGSSATPLSTQQFLDCSDEKMRQTFSYCWAQGQEIEGSPWMRSSIEWDSSNEGCNGGMTHAAFQYAATNAPLGLVAELDLPYTEGEGGVRVEQCNIDDMEGAARITGWKQAVGIDCSSSTNVNELLKLALQSQPISVAVNSEGNFKNYKSGIYKCPNNGDFPQHSMINHALFLVGHGTDPVEGDYWILKNSYGAAWGENGFMRIQADNKINCGISVYPVIPQGATTGDTVLNVEGGGKAEFLGLQYSVWIGVAAIAIGATLIIIAFGIVHARQARRRQMQNHYRI